MRWIPLFVLAPALLAGQGVQVPQAAPSPPPAPATKMEAFQPAAGVVTTLAYNEIGNISSISVDARELRDQRGAIVRGVRVEITESQYRQEQAFIDTDELSELLKGIDALLAVNGNPTNYQNFEVRYTTKGGLQLVVYNTKRGEIKYAVRAGRVVPATTFVNEAGLRSLRAMFESANQLFATQANR